MLFRKYEFDTKEKWEEVRETLYKEVEGEKILISEISSIVELGFIYFAYNEEGACIDESNHYAVDMLLNEPVNKLNEFEVWPKPMGVTTFMGLNYLYEKAYCDLFPEADCCKELENEDLF